MTSYNTTLVLAVTLANAAPWTILSTASFAATAWAPGAGGVVSRFFRSENFWDRSDPASPSDGHAMQGMPD
jgi:hypothetical protein